MSNPLTTNPILERPFLRGRYQGIMQILRFNWPWYAGAFGILLTGCALLRRLNVDPAIKGIIGVGIACALCWMIASVLVSHWIYDLSALTKWAWIAGCIPEVSMRAASIHCGFDESIDALRSVWPQATIFAWDIYQPDLMTEGSIARARRNQTAPAATHVSYAKLPQTDNVLDTIFLIFAAHEIRSAKARDVFFHELFRVLKPGGTVLLVEHLRDWRNFLAYGPGFLHFLGAKEWLRLAKEGRLVLAEQFRITPFILVLKLSKPQTR
jgi:SAM-dependent methyltransferase